MTYTFKGNLWGWLCTECKEALSNVKVRLYRNRPDQNVVALAVSEPKGTFALLDNKRVASKASSLLAEVTTGEDGSFTVELNADKDSYDGGPFEIDVYCESVPHLKPSKKPPAPQQFSITTLQPMWRRSESGAVAAWDYALSAKFWCGIRARFDAWVICGQVKICKEETPVVGVKVRAFDRDWIQDDDLGAGLTDATGHFRIDYHTDDFTRTVFSPEINFEISGPDVYFKIETPLGTTIMAEAPSEGRTPGRENVPHCFCVDLCVDKDKQPPAPTELAVFDSIGALKFMTDIHSASGGSGLTVSDSRAFFSTLRLNGILLKTLNNQPAEYLFEWAEDTGGPLAWQPVLPSQIAPTVLGTWEHYTGDIWNPVETAPYYLNNAGAPHHTGFTADGWAIVPQESQVFSAAGNFHSNGNMIMLNTTTLTAGTISLGGHLAGSTAGPSFAADKYFAFRMWVRPQGNSAQKQLAGTCRRLAITNVRYTNMVHHPSWAPINSPPGGELAVGLLDIAELVSAPCSEITSTLSVQYTAAHPNLGDIGLSMTGPGGPYSFTFQSPAPVGSTPQNTFGTATPNFNVATLQPCAYIVHMSVNALLTTGDSVPSALTDEVAFCKKM